MLAAESGCSADCTLSVSNIQASVEGLECIVQYPSDP